MRRLLIALALAPVAAASGEEPPTPELLEFLGEFATDDGGWMDPAMLDGGPAPAPAPATEAE